jgi:hypothetical protein
MNLTDIQFLPQGLVICFYGSIGIVIGFYLILRVFWSVGSGFNEYNKEKKQLRIFRLGFPGKYRYVDLFYSFSEIETLFLESQNTLTGSNLYLILKGKQKICLTQIGKVDSRSTQEIESFSTRLAQFLQIPLDGVLNINGFILFKLN